MRVILKLPTSERKWQDRSIRRAEKSARVPPAANDFRFLEAPMGAWTSKTRRHGVDGLDRNASSGDLGLNRHAT